MGTLNPQFLKELNDADDSRGQIVEAFYNNQISLEVNDYANTSEYNNILERVLTILLSYTPGQIIEILKASYVHKAISTEDIPQFSDLSAALYRVPRILNEIDRVDLSYDELGRLMWNTERKGGADKKYGENHAKTAAFLNLTSIDKGGKGRSKVINLTDFGRLFLSLNPAQQALLIPLLWLKVPLFYNYFCANRNISTLNSDISILEKSTQARRRSNINTIIDIIDTGYFFETAGDIKDSENKDDIAISEEDIVKDQAVFLRAMRTKPFLLLAGISGTGKSRIVKQMAFDSCPDIPELRKDPASPGNYCLIEVKPNWHDSSELLGYESRIGGSHYQLTPFIKFLVRAMLYPETPFFVCLDEMNLAPVEQYFAEFLSVLESRTKIDGRIVTEPLIKASVFSNFSLENELRAELYDLKIIEEDSDGVKIFDSKLSDAEVKVYNELKIHGLRIPENVAIIGTVNMDETTHQFSRKVIDRAMTIEMNLPEGNPFMDFFTKTRELRYLDKPVSYSKYHASQTKASDVIQMLSEDNPEKIEWLKQEIAEFMISLNDRLEGTPFKVAFRVQNELILYFFQVFREMKDSEWQDVLNIAIDQILMMKVLPRIEGDEELLEESIDKLLEFTEPYPNAYKKVTEMKDRLGKSRFTSFWP